MYIWLYPLFLQWWKLICTLLYNFLLIVFFFFLRRYLFIWVRAGAEEGAEGEGETEQRLMWDSIPGPWEHDLSQREMLNWLCHSGAPFYLFFQVLPFLVISAPTLRLDLTTLRSGVMCSSAWANQTLLNVFILITQIFVNTVLLERIQTIFIVYVPDLLFNFSLLS